MDLKVIANKLNNKAELQKEEESWIETHHPQHCLIVYGSLAPGESNYDQLKNLKGNWFDVEIAGRMINPDWRTDGSYPNMQLRDIGLEEKVHCRVFKSSELESHWPRLDYFEGEEYFRVFHPFQGRQLNGIGYIYASKT